MKIRKKIHVIFHNILEFCSSRTRWVVRDETVLVLNEEPIFGSCRMTLEVVRDFPAGAYGHSDRVIWFLTQKCHTCDLRVRSIVPPYPSATLLVPSRAQLLEGIGTASPGTGDRCSYLWAHIYQSIGRPGCCCRRLAGARIGVTKAANIDIGKNKEERKGEKIEAEQNFSNWLQHSKFRRRSNTWCPRIPSPPLCVALLNLGVE